MRASLFRWSASGFALTVAFTAVIAAQHSAATIVPAVAVAVGWWALITAVLVGGAALLTKPSGEPVESYGVPNGLTVLRAWLCCPLFLCAYLSLPGRLGLVLWGAVGGPVGLFDAIDGIVARRFGQVTVLGKALDPLMDALFFIVGAIGSLMLGILPLWLAVLIAFRYGAPLIGTPIVLLAHRRPELVHTVWGRRNTILTGVVMFTLLIVRVSGGPVETAALIAALPTLVPTMVLHFLSLARRTSSAPVAA